MNQIYIDYLESDHWRNLRRAAIATWGDRCSNCALPKVDVHHLRYGNLYDVSTDDLMPLCRRCHDAVHESQRLRELLASGESSHIKRNLVLGFLAGRDEQRTIIVPRTSQYQIIFERIKIGKKKKAEFRAMKRELKSELSRDFPQINGKKRKYIVADFMRKMNRYPKPTNHISISP